MKMSRLLSPQMLDTTAQHIRHERVCMCCLDSGGEMIRLASCKHSGFLMYYTQLKIVAQEHLACRRCHNLLLKIEQFRTQVEQSAELLRTQSQAMQPASSKLVYLQLQPPHITDSTQPVADHRKEAADSATKVRVPASDLTKELDLTKVLVPAPELTKEVDHTEVGSDSRLTDSDSDAPLVDVKAEKSEDSLKNTRSGNAAKRSPRQRTSKTSDQYKGLFKLVHLTEAEISAERARMAADDAYLRLPFKCTSCLLGFDYETTLHEHNQKRHGDKEGFKCATCLSVLSTEPSYRDHLRRHAKRYECLRCQKRVVTVESARSHCRRQHGLDPRSRQHSCHLCQFTTEKLRVYRYHLDKHKEKPQCTECGRTFINASILKNHQLTVHARDTRTFACEPCGKCYASRSGLSAHIADYHNSVPSEKAFCEKCGAWFKCQRNLTTHLRCSLKHRSVAEDRYKCNECPKTYHMKSQLEEHISFVHLNELRHKCALCGDKAFMNKAQLKKHIKVVHEKASRARDKICDYCGRAFTCNSILRTHIRTHTGERPLRCQHCAASFAHPGALYTHQRLLHPPPPP